MIRGATVTSRALVAQSFEIIATPLWWYSFGIVWLLRTLKNSAVDTWEYLAVGLWLRNLFVPMYGQNDFVGRLISFIIRIVQIFFRGLVLLVWFLICSLVLAVWLIFPLVLFIA